MISNISIKYPFTFGRFTSLKINHLFPLLILLVCMAGVSACSEKVEFELKDSGMSASVGSINWLDNERVIFVNKIGLKGRIYIWNAMTNDIEMYAPEATGGICYSDRYIRYQVKRTDNYRVTHLMKGKFGEEKLFVYDWRDKKQDSYDVNKFSCKRFMIPPEHNNKKIHYLKEEHGYLYLGEKGARSNDYPVLVKPDGERFTMPFNVHRSPKGYYPFKGAYFFWPVSGASKSWEKSYCGAWWLYPDGKSDGLCVSLPKGVINGSVLLYPVINGYLFISHGTGGRVGVGHSGVYYYDKNMRLVSKLLSGQANGFAISPNGCKAAFVLNPIVNKNITLKAIDVCNSK